MPATASRVRRLRRVRVPFALLLLATACAESPTGPPAALTGLPRALTVAEGEVSARSNAFAFDLFRRAAVHADSNSFVSPLSVSMALGMTMNGAANATLDSMRRVLGFEGMAIEDINAGYAGLVTLLRGLDRTTDLRIANSVWVRQGLVPHPTFAAALDAHFDAPVRALDFGAASSLVTINRWADEATNGRIPKVLDALPDDLVMLLMNAIYFKGKWRAPFERSETRMEPFHAAFGGVQSVPMMQRELPARVSFRQQFTLVELAYGNDAFAMDLLVPTGTADLDSIVQALTPAAWDALTADLRPVRLMVALPRFKLEYSRILNGDLAALGMANAFEEGAADFRYLFADEQPGPFIDFVKHDTFLSIDEEGTEAAAVTTVGIVATSGPPTVRADRPFLLVLRERFSGTILFMGRIQRVPQ